MTRTGDSESTSAGSQLFLAVAAAVVLYFAVFGLVVLDEFVLGTRFFADHTPAWTKKVFRLLYAPLLSD